MSQRIRKQKSPTPIKLHSQLNFKINSTMSWHSSKTKKTSCDTVELHFFLFFSLNFCSPQSFTSSWPNYPRTFCNWGKFQGWGVCQRQVPIGGINLSGGVYFWLIFNLFSDPSFSVILRPHLQQHCRNRRLQAQRRLCYQQKEQNGLQGVPFAQMPPSRDVQERIPLRSPLQLVQNPLPAAGAADHVRHWGRERTRRWTWRSEYCESGATGTPAAGEQPGQANLPRQN